MSEILGISTFSGSSLVATQVASSATDNPFQISDDTAALLFRYMSSFRFHHASTSAHTSGSSSRSSTPTRQGTYKRAGLPQIMFSLGDRPPDVDVLLSSSETNASTARASTTAQQTQNPERGFLGPPSLSLLSTLDEIRTLDGPFEGTRVWALPISLSLTTNMSTQSNGDKKQQQQQHYYRDAIVSMYFNGDYAFLLYMQPYAPSVDADSGRYIGLFQRFLQTLPPPLLGLTADQGALSKAQGISMNGIHNGSGISSSNSTGNQQPMKWDGCQVIFIDRERHSLFLHGADQQHSPSSTASSFFKPPVSEALLLTYGLDSRHFLASRLSLDATLALEGAMEELRFHNGNDSNRCSSGNSSSSTAFEACTSLSNQWVYAHAVEHQELYILFDATKYVTITDVQRQALEIRSELSAAAYKK